MVEFYNKLPFQFSNRLETASVDLLRALCSDCEDLLGLGAQLCHAPDLLVSTCPLRRQKGHGGSRTATGTGRAEPPMSPCMAVALGAGNRLWVHWQPTPGAGFTARSVLRGLGSQQRGLGLRVWVFQLLPLLQA